MQSVTDANQGKTLNTYDQQNGLTAFTDQRGLRTEYRYDGFGRKVAQISPDTGETKYRYDLANNLIEQKDARGEITRHEYDALNRVLATRYPTAENDEPQADIVYSYDNPASEYGIGRLSTVTDTTGETRYNYNHRGQVAQQLTIVDGVEYATVYNYNAQGQLASMVYPSGREVTYALNKQGLVSNVATQYRGETASIADNFRYLPFGPLSAMNFGNDTQLNMVRDLDLRITDIQLTGQSANDVLYDVGYIYDNVSNIKAIDDRKVQSNSQVFNYDKVSRLVESKGAYGEISYGYDAVGNRLSRRMAHSGQAALAKQETYAYASDSNRLLRVDSEQGIKQESRSLGYDSVGNIVQDSRQGDARRLRYGAANRLLDVSAANDEQTSKVPGSDYRYNAKGQRVIKIVDGHAIYFHYDAFDRLISETNDQGLPLREYIYGAGQRLALVDYEHSDVPKLGAIQYVLNDHLGTPQMLLDAKQSIVWSAQGTRTPFGENLLASNDSNIKQPLQFPGQYADETGYSYNYFRDYDPSLGRYIQSDPIGLGGGVNTFGYVGGNPLTSIDVLGLCEGTLYAEFPEGFHEAAAETNPFEAHAFKEYAQGVVMSEIEGNVFASPMEQAMAGFRGVASEAASERLGFLSGLQQKALDMVGGGGTNNPTAGDFAARSVKAIPFASSLGATLGSGGTVNGMSLSTIAGQRLRMESGELNNLIRNGPQVYK